MDPPEKNRGHFPEVFSDDEEETLSLCDLPIHGHSADSDEFDRRSLSSSDDQEFFEFSVKDLSFSSHGTEKNIIFCGKLIPLGEQQPIRAKTQKLTNSTPSTKKRCVFETKSNSSSLGKSRVSKKGQGMRELDSAVSVMASSAKSRWYVYMLGSARFPMEMELRDIKERQSRRSGESCGGGGRSRGKGLWGLVRAMGCKSPDHADTMVKASFACI